MDLLKRYSDASGDSVSNIVFQILDGSKQVFELGIQMVNTAKKMDADARKALVHSLEPELVRVHDFTAETLKRVASPSEASPSGGCAGKGGLKGANPLAINKGVRSNKTHQNSAKPYEPEEKKVSPVWLATTKGG
jgi:hypothetical protein